MNKKFCNPVTNLDGNIEIIGFKRIIVENIVTIIEYSDERIIIDVGSKIINILGLSLEIYDYFNKILVIDGKIETVTFQ